MGMSVIPYPPLEHCSLKVAAELEIWKNILNIWKNILNDRGYRETLSMFSIRGHF
jgi:hypothetical protein